MSGGIARVLLALVACTGIWLAGSKLPNESVHTQGEEFVPDPQMADLAAFGFEAVAGDLHWLRAVQIAGSPNGTRGRNGLIGALIDVVTTLDPWVDHPYRFAAVWMTEDEAAVRQANEFLRRGIEHHPDDWRGYFYLAFNHFFFLGEQEEAARVLEPALTLEGSPLYLSRLVARLKGKSGGLDAAAAFLSELASRATDASERAEYERALREIEVERRARFLDAARVEYVRRHGRDIEQVDDLVTGNVLRAIPEDPFEAGWEISTLTGEIVSSHVRYRYGVKIDGTNRKLLDAFRERSRGVRTE